MPAGSRLAHARQPIAVLPQRILLLENSRAYTSMLREAIEQRTQLPISVATSLAEARELLDRESDWFLALTGLVLADGDRDQVIDFFVERRLPTIVVSGVYDDALRERALEIPEKVVARLGMSLAELERAHEVLTRLNAAAVRGALQS